MNADHQRLPKSPELSKLVIENRSNTRDSGQSFRSAFIRVNPRLGSVFQSSMLAIPAILAIPSTLNQREHVGAKNQPSAMLN
jgi:hypothetical protein